MKCKASLDLARWVARWSPGLIKYKRNRIRMTRYERIRACVLVNERNPDAISTRARKTTVPLFQFCCARMPCPQTPQEYLRPPRMEIRDLAFPLRTRRRALKRRAGSSGRLTAILYTYKRIATLTRAPRGHHLPRQRMLLIFKASMSPPHPHSCTSAPLPPDKSDLGKTRGPSQDPSLDKAGNLSSVAAQAAVRVADACRYFSPCNANPAR